MEVSEVNIDSINGILKAAVLPVPVCAEPSISLPAIARGIAWAWIGVGSLKSIFFKALLSPCDRLKPSKLFI